jgi:hypothetical protein
MIPKLGAVFLLAASAFAAESDSALLFSECSDASEIKRVVQTTDTVAVHHSLAGGPETCYSVSVSAGNGNVMDGFLLGSAHPAVAAFERNQQNYVAQAFTPPSEAKKQNHPKAVARARPYKLWNPFSSRSGTK